MAAKIHPLQLVRSPGACGPKIEVKGSQEKSSIRIVWKPKRGQWVGVEVNEDDHTIRVHGRFSGFNDANLWINRLEGLAG